MPDVQTSKQNEVSRLQAHWVRTRVTTLLSFIAELVCNTISCQNFLHVLVTQAILLMCWVGALAVPGIKPRTLLFEDSESSALH